MNPSRFNPFPGLRAFRMEEKFLFFGREEQTAELLRRLRTARFLAVVGTSGSGKSSLVQAGLLPELHGGTMLGAGSHWEVVVLRPGGNPLGHLAEALVAADLYDSERPDIALEVRATLSRSGFGLVEAARQSDLAAGTNLLVVVDQFEEIFRFRRSGSARLEEAGAFVNLLLEAARQQDLPIYVVLTMRSDYLGDCAEFPGLAEAVNRGEYLIPRLDRTQKRAAIAGPIRVGGGEMAPRLLQKLLNDVGENPDHLPVLQHALMRTWEAWEHDHAEGEPIDLRHYRAVGEMAEALSRHADEVYGELPDDRHRLVCEKVFKALTERSADNRGIRRPASVRRLCDIAATDESTLFSVVDPFRRLGRTFLLPFEGVPLEAGTVIDISHESLMRVWRRLDAWVEEESQSARVYRRLVESAALHRAGKAALYHDPDLQIAQSWRAVEDSNAAWADQYGGGFDEAMAFLDESARTVAAEREAAEAGRRREIDQAHALAEAEARRAGEQAAAARKLRRLLAVAACVALVAVAASAFALIQRGRAERSEQAVQGLADQLEIQLVRGDLESAHDKIEAGQHSEGLAHLARAMRTDPDYTVAGHRALWTLAGGMIPPQRFAPLRHEKPIEGVLSHVPRDLVLTSSEGGADVRIWNVQTGAEHFRLPQGFGFVSMDRAAGGGAFDLPEGLPFVAFDEARDAQWILHASDNRADPGSNIRHYRRRVPLSEIGPLARLEAVLCVDDFFTLRLDGTPVGSGRTYGKYLQYADLTEFLARRRGPDAELVIEIEAENAVFTAGVVGLFRLTGADGRVHTEFTDGAWESSESAGGTYAPVQRLGAIHEIDWGGYFRGRFRWRDTVWSADRKRLIAVGSHRPAAVSWDLETGERTGAPVVVALSEPAGDKDEPTRVEVGRGSGDGGDIAVIQEADGSLALRRLSDGGAVSAPLQRRGSIVAWQLSPDRRLVAAICADFTLAVWRLADGALIAEIPTRPHRVEEVFFNAEGTWIAAAAVQGTQVNWWPIAATDAERSEASKEASWVEVGPPTGPTPVDFVRDEPLIVLHIAEPGASPGSAPVRIGARTYDLATREVAATIDLGEPGPTLHQISASHDPWAPTMLARDELGGLVQKFEMLWVQRLDGFGLVGKVDGDSVSVWDVRDGALIAQLRAQEPLQSAILLPDGRTLVAGSVAVGSRRETKKLYVFDLLAGAMRIYSPLVVSAPGEADQFTIVPSPDGSTLATTSGSSGEVAFWDLRTGEPSRAPVGMRGAPDLLSFSARGDRLLAFVTETTFQGSTRLGQNFGEVALHQTGLAPAIPGTLVRTTLNAGIHRAGAAPRWWTYERDIAGVARIGSWDASSGERLAEIPLPAVETSSDSSGTWSHDGSRLLVWTQGTSRAGIVDVASGALVGELHTSGTNPRWTLSRDGRSAALGSSVGEVTIWTEGRDTVTCRPFIQTQWITHLRFSPDGSLLAVANNSAKRFTVVEAATGTSRFEAIELPNPVEHTAFLAGGERIAVAAGDPVVRIVDCRTGEVVDRIEIEDWARWLDLSPDGRILAIASGSNLQAMEGRAYLWDLESRVLMTPPLVTSGTVRGVQFSPDATVLATILHPNPSASVRLWDVATGTPLTDSLFGPGNAVPQDVAFLADGTALGVAWVGGLVQTLPLPPRGRVPEWLPELVEAVGGARLRPETGTIEPVEDALLETVRKRFSADPGTDDAGWKRWAHWMFQDSAVRPIAPGVRTTLADLVTRLRGSPRTDDVVEAARLAPNDPVTLAVLAARLAGEIQPGASTHWKDAIVRVSDRAVELDPDNREVWTRRAEMFGRFGDQQSMIAATERAGRRRPDETNDSGRSDGANEADQDAAPATDHDLLLLQAQARLAEGDEVGAADAFSEFLLHLERRLVEGDVDEIGQLLMLSPGTVGVAAPRREITLPEPIPGTFEDFESVAEGSLPPGWSARDFTAPSSAAGAFDLNRWGSDAWRGWGVAARDRLIANGRGNGQAGVWLGIRPNQFLDGEPVRALLHNHVLHAESEGRGQGEIQFLTTRDFDCSGRSGIHVAFASQFQPDSDKLGALEYSVDGGANWLPVFYRIHENDIVRDADGAIDAVATLTKEHTGDAPLNAYVEDGEYRPPAYGSCIAAPIDAGLAPFIEVLTTDRQDDTTLMRWEVYPLPAADGRPAVRLRFAHHGTSSWRWTIDDFGLYAISEDAPGPVVESDAAGDGRPPAIFLADSGLDTLAGALEEATTPTAVMAARLQAAWHRQLLPGESRPWQLEALALARAGDFPPALAAMRRAIALHPETPAYWRGLADVHERWAAALGEADRAEAAALATEVAVAVYDAAGLHDEASRERFAAAAGAERAEFLPFGAGWQFLDTGADPGPSWREPAFDDRAWRFGAAPLGYGDEGMATTIASGPADAKHLAAFFRTEFELPSNDGIAHLELEFQRDDGLVVHLNGREIARSNMPAGDAGFDTPAAGLVDREAESQIHRVLVPADALVPGRNVVAASVHQLNRTSSDLRFDLRLSGLRPESGRLADLAALETAEAELALPDDLRVLVRVERARRLADAGQADLARLLVDSALAIDAESIPARWIRARLLAEAGDDASSLALYRELVDGALALRSTVLDDRRLFLPPLLREFSRLTEANWFTLALAAEAADRDDVPVRAIARIVDALMPRTPVEDRDFHERYRRRATLRILEQGYRLAGETERADAIRAERETLDQVPPRDPGLSPKLVDLTEHYHGLLWDQLARLPETFVPRHGVTFDLRGIIELETGPLRSHDGRTANEAFAPAWRPDAITGIRVGQKAPAIHFLVGAGLAWDFDERDAVLATFVMHYEDGTSESFPLRFLTDVADWYEHPVRRIPEAGVGWRGMDPRPGEHGIRVLAEPVWRNPHPDKTIKSIDFVSGKVSATPVLVGITLE